MTNTKWLSALLAGTALTVASTAAMAETSLYFVSPVADMPASATQVSVSGELRAVAFAYKGREGDGIDADETYSNLGTRARVNFSGSTETSVGTVGAFIRLQNVNGNETSDTTTMNTGYGYWQASPEWQLLVGRTDSIGAIAAGTDWNLNSTLYSYYGGPTNTTNAQVRGTYTTGPLSWAVAVEDTNSENFTDSNGEDLAFGTSLTYTAGTGVDVTFSGIMQDDGSDKTDYFVGAGVNTSFNGVGVTAAIGAGNGYSNGTYLSIGGDEAYTVASLGMTFAVSEATSVEVALAYADDEDNNTVTDIGAAVLWSPAKQLTLGAGVGYSNWDAYQNETSGGIGAWFKF